MVEGVRLKVERCKSMPAAPKTRAPKVMGSSPQERTGPAPKVRFNLLGFLVHFPKFMGTIPQDRTGPSQVDFYSQGFCRAQKVCSVEPLCLEDVLSWPKPQFFTLNIPGFNWRKTGFIRYSQARKV